MDKKEYFKLRLKGWWYKGLVEDWYYEQSEAWAKYGFAIKGTVKRAFCEQEVCFPQEIIYSKERIDGEVMIFLIDNSCYKLGTARDE